MTVTRIGAWVDRRGVGDNWREWLEVARGLGITDVSLCVHAQDAGRPFDPFRPAARIGEICRGYGAAGIRPHIMLWPQPVALHAATVLAYVQAVRDASAGYLASAELDVEEQYTRHASRLAQGKATAAQYRAGWSTGLPLVVNGITASLSKFLELVAIADVVIPQAYTADRPGQRSTPGARQTVVIDAWRKVAPSAAMVCGLAAYNQDGLNGLTAGVAMGRAFDAVAVAGVTGVQYWSLAELAGGPDAKFVRERCAARKA